MEMDPGKLGQALELKALYDYAGVQAAICSTWQDLQTAMAAKATALGVGGKLPNVQAAAGAALISNCPTAATLASPIDKACAAAVFAAASKALNGLSK